MQSNAPAGAVIVNVTELASPTTVFPPASCTATTGWVGNGLVAGPPTGCVVKPNLAAGPTVMVSDALTADVNPVAVAVNVYGPALSIRHAAKVATPRPQPWGWQCNRSRSRRRPS